MLKDELQKVDIFFNIEDTILQKIIKITTIKKMNKDNILFYEGDSPDYFYILLEGNIKVYKTDLKGKEIVLHYFTQATFIAERASLENINLPATSIATKDNTKVALIKQDKFIELLRQNSDFSFYLIKSLTKKIKNLETIINRNLIYDSTLKVCTYIYENPTLLKEYKNIEIASILNMSPETFSRVLTKLKKLEVIDKKSNIIDYEKLSFMCDI